MPPRFAELEARTANAGLRHLANASVTGGALDYNAILDRPTADAFGNALSGDSFALTYVVASDPALKRNDVRVVNGVSYKVHEPPRALDDGAMAVALLELVP